MSDDRDRPAKSDPHHSVMTFTYDGRGPQTGVPRNARQTSHMDYGPADAARVPQAATPDAPQSVAGQPRLRQSLEFRLCGSEAQAQTIALDGLCAGTWIVAIERVRGFLSGDGPAGAAATRIGGVEVDAEVRTRQVVCTAQVSDFGPGDLVVVQVDLAVYCGGGGR